MERLVMCRICLCEKVELKCISNTKLQEVYQKLTCLPLKTEDQRPLTACDMCIALLRKVYKLMIVCLEAEQWYTNVIKGMDCLKPEPGCMSLSVVTIPTMVIGCYVKLYDIASRKKIDEHHQPTTEDTISIKVDPEITNGTSDTPIDRNENQLNDNEDKISETSESPIIDCSESKLDEAEIIYEYSEENSKTIDSPIPDKRNSKYGGLFNFRVSEDEDETSHPSTPKVPTKKNKAKTKKKKKIAKKKKVLRNKNVSSKQEEFKCDQCSKVFPVEVYLRRHSFVHNKKVIGVCNVCLRSFTNPATFYKHVRSHSTPYQCQKCPKAFPAPMRLKIHMGTHGIGRREYTCDHCNTSYSTKKSLKYHIICKHHSSLPPLICQKCDKPFPNRYVLERHLLVHGVRRRYQCDICAKEFNWKATLKAHILAHKGILPKPFICAVCNFAFALKSALKKHILRQCGEMKQKCELCGETFVQLKHLKQHKRNAHSIGLHECDVCKKQLASPAGLKSHKRTHTGERLHRCHICYRSFTAPATLKTHVRTHTGERPYKCQLCPKAFAQKTPLTTHMRTHEKNKK